MMDLLLVWNTLPRVKPMQFVRVRQATKKVADMKFGRRVGKERIAPIKTILDLGVKGKDEIEKAEEAEKIFALAPKKLAVRLNDMTAVAAGQGATISSWDPRKLAAIEQQLDLSYRQSQFFRWFLKEAGCEKLFRGCDEKLVRAEKKAAGCKVEYVVGKLNIFSKKDGSHTMHEPTRDKISTFASWWISLRNHTLT